MTEIKRLRPNVVLRQIVRNRSSRHGAKPKLIVLHSTEGANMPGIRDLQGLAGWFDNPKAQASSHVAVDAEGQSARMVPDADKAWTQASFNPVCLSIEMVGRASQTSWPEPQVREVARWIAHWNIHAGIPIRFGAVLGGVVVRSGVVSHKKLGILGGGHTDPGAGFPRRRCLRMAREIAAARRGEES